MTTAIELRDFSIGWGPRRVLLDLQLDVAVDSVLAILGPGSSGKSTLLQTLGVLLGGSRRTPEGLWWRGSATISVERCVHLPQHGSFSPRPLRELLPASEDVELWLPRDPSVRADLLGALNLPLSEVPDHARRFVSVLIAATQAAPLLLLDEPCFGLPAPWEAEARRVLQQLRGQARGFVLVTHNLELARSLADHAALLVDGVMIEFANAHDFFNHPRNPRTRSYLEWGA